MKIITSTHYNRPFCTKTMIEYLSRCENIDMYHVVFFVEPGCSEVLEIIENSSLNKTVVRNDSLFGCWNNKKQAIKHGFENSDYVIHLEDDVLLSKDALLYFEFCKDVDVGTVTAYNNISLNDYIRYDMTSKQVSTRYWYNSTAWAMHISKYRLLENWSGEDQDLMRQIHYKHNLCEAYPCLSRANNIGHVNGVNSHAIDILKLVGNLAYAPIGISKNGCYFVSDKQAYLDCLKQQEQNDIIKAQIDKCNIYNFENQLVVNESGDEFVKLDDTNYKSRDNSTYFKDYFLTHWADNYDILQTEFVYRENEHDRYAMCDTIQNRFKNAT